MEKLRTTRGNQTEKEWKNFRYFRTRDNQTKNRKIWHIRTRRDNEDKIGEI